MKPRIAIPVPHSRKPEYAQRSLPLYTRAVAEAGGNPVVIPLDIEPEEIAKRITACHAVLLPGSAADIDPQKYGAQKLPGTDDPDPRRDTADELLLQDAYNLHKPILGICYGMQMLNVYNTGTLVQDIPGHKAPAKPRAHTVCIDPLSRLAGVLGKGAIAELEIPVNSSHHQAAEVVGDGLRVVARCPQDKVIEAVEGISSGHFVLGVQWHPERSFDDDPASQAIFRALVAAARDYQAADKRRETQK